MPFECYKIASFRSSFHREIIIGTEYRRSTSAKDLASCLDLGVFCLIGRTFACLLISRLRACSS